MVDHTGQILAVVWSKGSVPADRATTLVAISDAHGIPTEELSAQARADALRSFRGGDGWHLGADVDRLSEQQARVIADRLLARLVTKAGPATRSSETHTARDGGAAAVAR